MVLKESNSDDVVVCCLDEGSTSVHYTLRIQQDFRWTVSLRGISLQRDTCPLIAALPELLASVSMVCAVTETLSTC